MMMLKTAAAILAAGCMMSVSTANGADLPKDANTTCPVMTKEKVDPELSVEHEGKTIFVCCTKCKRKFRENPEKYLKRLDGAGEAKKPAVKDKPAAK